MLSMVTMVSPRATASPGFFCTDTTTPGIGALISSCPPPASADSAKGSTIAASNVRPFSRKTARSPACARANATVVPPISTVWRPSPSVPAIDTSCSRPSMRSVRCGRLRTISISCLSPSSASREHHRQFLHRPMVAWGSGTSNAASWNSRKPSAAAISTASSVAASGASAASARSCSETKPVCSAPARKAS